MPSYKPVVNIGGVFQNIPAGSTLNATVTNPEQMTGTSGEGAATTVIGMPVYCSGNDIYKQAKADAAGTMEVVGLCATTSAGPGAAVNVITDGPLTATTGQWDAVAGTVGGLTAGTVYYLSSTTLGNITSTSPSAAGTYSRRLGVALSTTEFLIKIGGPFLN